MIRGTARHLNFGFTNEAPGGQVVWTFKTSQHPATLELAVVVTGPPGVPNRPEVWVIGASQKGRRKMLQLYYLSPSRITLDYFLY